MIYIILPVFNEENVIGKLLDRIKAEMSKNNYLYKIYAVNDGSTDNTRNVVVDYTKHMPVVLLDNCKNQGVGETFRLGFNEVLKVANDADTIITMDADNSHDPKVIKLMQRKLDEGYEVVLASCFATGGMLIGLPFLRYLLTIWGNLIYRVTFPIKGINEYTGFYRGYNAGALRKANSIFHRRLIESNGFAVMAELLIKLRRVPLFITEVPLILRYDLKGEKSKMKVLPTIMEHLKIISKNLLKRRII